MLEIIGRICAYEHLGCLDGPGVRSVVFLAGCPIRCIYCHNADMISPKAGQPVGVKEVLAELARYESYCTGGVTLSGGEPLLQTDFTIALLEALKERGRHTALDTAGTVYSERALDLADLVILDIKHTDADGFWRVTGGAIDNTRKTLAYLRSTEKPFWIRQVIVEGYTDAPEQIQALKDMAVGAQKIELLPYHTMGASKWTEPYRLKDMPPYPSEKLERLKKILTSKS